MQLGRYFVPAGTDVFVFPYLLHRAEGADGWRDAAAFRPARWLEGGGAEEAGRAEERPYLPFSLGQRNCVGMPLALLEIRLVLAALLRRWKFEYVPDEAGGAPRVVIYLTLVPNRMTMRLSPRGDA